MSRTSQLQQVLPLATRLAKVEAHREADIDDLTQVALYAYHKACVAQRRKRQRITCAHTFAFVVMRRAMRAYYHQQREWQGRGEPNKMQSLSVFPNGTPPTRTTSTATSHHYVGMQLSSFAVGLTGAQWDVHEHAQADLFTLDDYFAALSKACGPQARLVAENLIMPRGECARAILEEVMDKQARQARPRCRAPRPRGVKKQIRITPRMVRDALGMTPREWATQMGVVRQFTKVWLEKYSVVG